jgi:non-heme chloroperoxidase
MYFFKEEETMIIHSVQGGGGVQLHVREWGNASGPSILFIHGWSQNHLCWSKQYESELAQSYRLVALDIRGHGMSEAPREASAYQDPQLWADDIAAVIEQLSLERPILVGWSYGGFIICDYIRAYGQENISGIVFAGAATTLHPPTITEFIGPGFITIAADAASEDLPTSIRAMRQFMHNCIAKPLAPEDLAIAFSWQMVVRPDVRGALVTREINSDDVLRSLRVPLLVAHGRQEYVVLPAMAEHVLQICPTATASWYDDVGHAPFLEDPARFNRELAELVQQVRA